MRTFTIFLLLLVFPTLAVAQKGVKDTPGKAAGLKTWDGKAEPHHYHPPKFKHSEKPDSIIKKRKHSHRHKLHRFYGFHPRIKYYRRAPVVIEKT